MNSYDQNLFRIDVYIPFNDLSVDGTKMVNFIILVSIFVFFSKKRKPIASQRSSYRQSKTFFNNNKNIKIHTQA